MKQYNYIVGPTDTDSVSFCKPDMSKFTDEERAALLAELNELSPDFMDWEDDGYYKACLVVGAKNYVLWDGKNKTVKGSALKATTKEKALKRFIDEVIDLLLKDRKDRIFHLYLQYAQDILELTDITDWTMKKTVTKAVLSSERTNETRVMDALSGTSYVEGDKVYMFYLSPEELCLRERFTGQYCVDTLLKKLHGTLEIFGSVIDTDLFPDFTLERNKDLLGLETKKQKKAKLAVVTEIKVKPPTEVKMTRNTIPESFWTK